MLRLFFLVHQWTVFVSTPYPVSSKEIRLGILLPVTGSWNVGTGIIPAIDIAIERIKSHPNLLEGFNFSYVVENSKCSFAEAIGKASDLLRLDPPIHVIIGPGCSMACLYVATLAKYYNKPMISYSCSSSRLADQTLYPTFCRTQPFSRMYAEEAPKILVKIMQLYRWKRAAILAADGNIWSPMAHSLKAEMRKKELHPELFLIYSNLHTSLSYLLDQVRKNARGN